MSVLAVQTLVAATALSLLCSTPVIAGTAEDLAAAAVADRDRDFVLALRLVRPLAEQGDGDALFALGRMYGLGHGVPQNWAQAERLYQKGVEAYRIAAQHGDAAAQFKLGVRYERGEGTQKDFVEAVHWYRMAAQQGAADAQQTLGGMYEDGKGVPQDFVLGYMWYNLAAAQNFGVSRDLRDTLAKRMTLEQIAEAQKLTRGLAAMKRPE